MKLILLGTTGYHPNDARHTACLMLPQVGVVLDAGTAMFRVHQHLCTQELDIFLTHAHLDHIVGIPYLHNVLRGKSMSRVTVHGTAETLAAVDEHLFAEPLFPVKPPCDFRPLDSDDIALPQGGVLRWFKLEHPGGSVGYRLDWPQASMAYVTDTTAGTDAAYVSAIRGVDLLVHECNYPDAQAEQARLWGHSSTSAVAKVAKMANVGRLVLVHVDPTATDADPLGLPVARRIFQATELGSDWMEIDF